MRVITKTHTGSIVSDTDLNLEYLYVGDYGKQNNIKANFLGYTKRIDKVEHTPVDITEKLVVTVSTQKGCPMNCNFCDCPKLGFKGNASMAEMLHEITGGIALSGIRHGKRLNVHFARMGEPTFNFDVIKAARTIGETTKGMFDEYHPVVSTMMPKNNKSLEEFLFNWVALRYEWKGGIGLQLSIHTINEDDRNKMFGNMSLSLTDISEIVDKLPYPVGRKYTLNFAVTSKSDLDPKVLDWYFDKKKFIIKLTPIHETKEAVSNGYEIVTDFDVYEKFEKPLIAEGWDVIVFVPSKEEDADRITCGNALLAIQDFKREYLGKE